MSLLITGEAKKVLEEAMKDGYVTVKLVKVLVVGSAGVGKTSLIKLLLDQDPPGERNSTGCLERSIRVIRVLCERREDQEEKWNELPQEELDKMIAEAVPVLVKDLNEKNEKTKPTTVASHGEDPNEGESSTEGDDRRESYEEGDGNEDQDATMLHTVSATNSKDVTGTIDTVREKLSKLVSSVKSSERLLNMELIYLTDTGGQQEYWDLAPIFTRDTSVTIFVHRLCDKLDDTPLNDVYERGERVGPSQKTRITTAQAFKTMLQNLACGKSRSKIIVVGTHKDRAGSCKETLEQKNQKFEEMVSAILSTDIIDYNDEDCEIMIFEVNTKTPNEGDEKEVNNIRTSIPNSVEKEKVVKIPIWWFILQQVLERIARKRGTDVLSKEDCIHASKALGFTEVQLNDALDFFDKLNIFLYKPNILEDVVFTSAQVPLDKLSELVHKRYQLKAAAVRPTRKSKKACSGKWKNFRDHATLYTSLLREFPRHYVNEVFTEDEFLKLLEKLLIVSKYSKSSADKCYFFPAILDVKEDIEIPNSSEIAPLVVFFPNGWAPAGVFCCTVCHLMSQAGWKIEKAEYVARNAITFARESEPGFVTIVDKIEYFAVHVNVDTKEVHGESLIQHCGDIKSEVFAAVKAGLDKTHHNESQPKSAFYCPTHKSHLATISKSMLWVCSKDSKKCHNLTPDQTVWLGGPGELLGRCS